MEKILGLYEGRGVAARNPGDTYVDKDGHVLTFHRVEFFNADVLNNEEKLTDELNSIKIEKTDSRDVVKAKRLRSKELISQITAEKKIKSKNLVDKVNAWEMANSNIATTHTNEVEESTSAAVIVVFDDEKDNKQKAFIKYMDNLPTNQLTSWGNDDFKKVTGYEYTSKLTKKEKSGIKASDILAASIGEGKKTITLPADEFITTIKANVMSSAKFSTEVKTDIVNLIDNFITGSADSVQLLDTSMATAYRDYLGEILAPYAIIKDKNVSGQAKEAEETLLIKPHQLNYSMMNIQMGASVTDKLIDSTLISADEKAKVGISSKAGGGVDAATSIVSLFEAFKSQNEEWRIKNSYASDIIQSISSAKNAAFNPLELARISGLVSDTEISDIPGEPNDYTKYLNYIKRQLKTSQELPLPKTKTTDTFMNAMKSSGKSKTFYKLLAGMAKVSAEVINNDPKFGITDAFLQLLNKSSLIQIYTNVYYKDGKMRFEGFSVKYPPKFKGKIKIWTSTRFKTTGISGKAQFKLIDKNMVMDAANDNGKD